MNGLRGPIHHDQPATVWIREAAEDVAAARHLLDGGHLRHVAPLLHLAVEKALKAVYRRRTGKNPPVTHDLRFLANKTELLVPEELHAALDALNPVTILHLYPEAAGQPNPFAAEADARRLLDQTDALMDWITDHL